MTSHPRAPAETEDVTAETLVVKRVDSTPRAHPRYEVTLPVDCTTQHVFVSSHVSNISKGGLFIRSERPLPLETEVHLVLHLPDGGRSIEAKGRVVWNYDILKGTSRIIPGSGIRFVDLAASDRELLEGYLRGLGAHAGSAPRVPTAS